jgi:hypothetical protein
MTEQQVIARQEVQTALGISLNIQQTNSRAENEAVAAHGDRMEIVEKPADKTTGVFVDGELVLFLCDGESCDLEDKAELVSYLRA